MLEAKVDPAAKSTPETGPIQKLHIIMIVVTGWTLGINAKTCLPTTHKAINIANKAILRVHISLHTLHN